MLSLNPSLTALVDFFTYGSNKNPDPTDANSTQNQATAVGYQLPNISDNTIETTVAVNSGETVILGGVMGNTETDNDNSVPYLGKIPLLGFFFRHTLKSKEPNHLMIFVTATIIGPSGEFLDFQDK